MTTFMVAEVRVGRARPFGLRGQPSAIDKQPVPGPVAAERAGLAGDEQGDPRHHGGSDRAIHAYAAGNYPLWRADIAEADDRFVPGAFGENLVVEGATDARICLGDRWRLGTAVLAVSQGRQPCWKLNVRFGRADMARRVQATGRSGWYFRVLEPGVITAGQTAHLTGRPHPEWSLTRVSHLLYRAPLDVDELTDFAALPGLPQGWRHLAERRLATGRLENWRARIDTPPPDTDVQGGDTA